VADVVEVCEQFGKPAPAASARARSRLQQAGFRAEAAGGHQAAIAAIPTEVIHLPNAIIPISCGLRPAAGRCYDGFDVVARTVSLGFANVGDEQR
jgi:hypothetical protein